MTQRIAQSPFSDDRTFVTAALRTISFQKLVNRDQAEQAKLLQCGEQDGFFYLDVTEPESEDVWNDYQKVLAITSKFFDQPINEKSPYAYNSDVQGYKAIGGQTGPTEGSRDGFETIRIAMDGLDRTEKPLPPQVLAEKALFEAFIRKSRKHVKIILASFSDAMGLIHAERFENMHDDAATSNSSMTFHRYPSRNAREANNIGHNKHTDVGSITFLLAQQWGLQVPAPSNNPDAWAWVRPRYGHAICNIGDSLRFISGMRLRSVLHRVVPISEMEHAHRFSTAYFIRPAHGTRFKDSEGRMISCDEWFAQKFDIMRASHVEQRKNTLLTGGIESVEQRLWVHQRIAAQSS